MDATGASRWASRCAVFAQRAIAFNCGSGLESVYDGGPPCEVIYRKRFNGSETNHEPAYVLRGTPSERESA